MNLHYTAEQIANFPAATVAQLHDAGEEADPDFQAALHRLAERCSACGQPMPEAAGR